MRELLEPATLGEFRRNAGALNNRAVFEISGFLAEIFDRTEVASPPTAKGILAERLV